MMQELRLVLIILGVVAIAALLLHGLWTSRKEKPITFSEKPIGKLTGKDDTDLDQHNIGSVRIVKSGDTEPKTARKEPGLSFDNKPDIDPLFAHKNGKPLTACNEAPNYAFIESTLNKVKSFDLPVPSTLDNNTAPESARLVKPVLTKAKVKSNKASNDFYQAASMHDENVVDVGTKKEYASKLSNAMNLQEELIVEDVQPQLQVLNINVQAGNNQEFDGTKLINCLEQHGLFYGKMEIFHRHMDLSETGKVLFSAANMFDPGSFPVATIHQFTTAGISLFMTLPCYGEAEQNFKLMLQTAQQVADELGGLVTDDRRNMMTPQRLDAYKKIIQQFYSHV
ncbi:cell division protein ZipA [Candidatus Enterovibrio altilux]|uniref:cell division protein ZipA n=1 Tax=Candidatus Enterovibrio altilux TaxID=1927128 RepID=UPI001237B514|nr:cell division protein ZipA [Candidatus Enterovibrio luxaltus]